MAEHTRVTADNANRFSRAPDARHLGHADFADLAADDLRGESREWVDAHLADCADCRAEADRLRAYVTSDEASRQRHRLWGGFLAAATAEPGNGAAVDRVLQLDPAKMRGRRVALKGVLKLKVPESAREFAVAAAGDVIADGRTGDFGLEWRLKELENGDFEGVFASSSAEMDGATLTLALTPPRPVTLVKVFGHWIGRFVIPKDQWARWNGRMISGIAFPDGDVVSWEEEDAE